MAEHAIREANAAAEDPLTGREAAFIHCAICGPIYTTDQPREAGWLIEGNREFVAERLGVHLPCPAGALTRGVLGRRDGSQGCVPSAHGFKFHGDLLFELAALITDELAGRTGPTNPAFAEALPDRTRVLCWAGSDDLKPGSQIETIYELVLQPFYVTQDKKVNCHTFAKLASTSELGREMCRIDGLFQPGTD